MTDRLVTWPDIAPHLSGMANVATNGPAGPHVAIVAPVVDDDGTVWFQTRRTSGKARAVDHDPRIALMWRSGSEAYLWGRATLVDDVAQIEARWTTWPYDAAGFFGRPDEPGIVLVRIEPDRATVMTVGADGPQRLRWTSD